MLRDVASLSEITPVTRDNYDDKLQRLNEDIRFDVYSTFHPERTGNNGPVDNADYTN